LEATVRTCLPRPGVAPARIQRNQESGGKDSRKLAGLRLGYLVPDRRVFSWRISFRNKALRGIRISQLKSNRCWVRAEILSIWLKNGWLYKLRVTDLIINNMLGSFQKSADSKGPCGFDRISRNGFPPSSSAFPGPFRSCNRESRGGAGRHVV